MINFNNFKSTTANNSNFVDTVSLEEMKSAGNGAAINVVPSVLILIVVDNGLVLIQTL